MGLSAIGQSKGRRDRCRNRVRRGRRLRLEELEDRRLLAFDWQSLLAGASASAADVGLVSSAVDADEPAKPGNTDAVATMNVAQPYVAGEVVVALRAELSADDYQMPLNGGAAPAGLTLGAVTDVTPVLRSRAADGSPLTLVKLSLQPGWDVLETVRQLELSSHVLWAAPNYLYQGDDPRELVPNDPRYSEQYHHTAMHNDEAWDITLGTANIIIAVTDDGVDLNHEDLAANVWVNADEVPGDQLDNDANGYVDDVSGWDFSSNDPDPRPLGGDSHGTHVAGIAAARTDNGIGVAGTAGQATVMPIRFYGSGAWTSTVIASSYAYAVDNGARIISTSYTVDSFVNDPTFIAGLQYMYDHGGLHFNSAGNNSQLNPARQAFEQSLMVASTDASDVRSDFSNYGIGIDVAAPGSNILATLPSNTYGLLSGTSMSTPNAAAAAALIWSAHPEWTRDQVAAQLLGTADNIDAVNPGYEGWLGAGRINTHRALTEDLPPPQVELVRGVPADGGRTAEEINRFAVRFDQILDAASADAAGNFELREAGGDGLFDTADDHAYTLARPGRYLVGTNEVPLTLTDGPLGFGRYRLRVLSGGIQNAFATALDGNRDGAGGDAYVHYFTIDVAPLVAVEPAGSLVYATQVRGFLGVPGETDSFDLGIAAGQTLTVAVVPGGGLQALVTVEGPGGFSAAAQGSAADADVVLQSLPLAVGGSYHFSLGGVLGSTGSYALTLTLNAAVEQEEHGGPANDSLAAAQDLGSSFVSLGGDADRGAVRGAMAGVSAVQEQEPNDNGVVGGSAADLPFAQDMTGAFGPAGLDEYRAVVKGSISAGSDGDWDFYRILAAPGETLTVDMQAAASGLGSMNDPYLRLYDRTGQQLRSDDDSGLGLEARLTYSGFSYSGDYYVVADSYLACQGTYTLTVLLQTTAPAFTRSEDWYRFTLADGQTATVVFENQDGAAGRLELYDAAQRLLAVGGRAPQVDQVIHGFLDAPTNGAADSYYARVLATAGTYSLIVTRSADFDIEPNNRLDQVQRIDGNDAVLGHTAGAAALPDAGGGSESSPDSAGAGTGGGGEPCADGYAAERWIVRLAGGLGAESRDSLADVGFAVLRELPLIDAVVVQSPAGMTAAEAEAFWSDRDEVLYAEPDYPFWTMARIPNDPSFAELYGLHNVGQNGGTVDADIDAPEAWEFTTGSAEVVVAVIDTGVDYRHQDLAANMWVNPGETPGDGIDNDGNGYVDDVYGIDAANHDTDPWDDNSHGTHVAGTIAAVGNNGVGVAGVNWTARIMALKFLDKDGYGDTANAVELLQYATRMKTQYGVNLVVSNNSWGGGPYSQALYDAIAASNAAGILFVAAAGNDGSDNDSSPFYPAGYELDGIVSVAATDAQDALASFSNYGATSVDLAAPGVSILSTTPNNYYGSMSGTSMASPHVAGAAALLQAFSPEAGLAEIKAALLAGVDPLPALEGRMLTGGRLNVVRSMAELGRGDVYAFAVAAGDALVLETATPGDAALAFVNDLDPVLELYDPSGTLVAGDEDGAGDGRNARITHVATADGIYRARVLGTSGHGEYILHLQGATGPLPGLAVTGSQPADGQVVGLAYPATYTLTFSDNVLLTSLDPGDLTVGGRPTLGVRAVDGRTIAFTVDAAGFAGDGPYAVDLPAGVIQDVRGQPNAAFHATFISDTTGPRIVATRWSWQEMPASRVLSTGALVVEATFSEPLAPISASLVTLRERTLNRYYTPTAVTYDPATLRVTAEFPVLPDGDYQFVLQSGNGYGEDVVGNDLDGEASGANADGTPTGNGTPGGSYALNFSLDVTETPLAGFKPLYPFGSLIYADSPTGVVSSASDTDAYTLTTDGGALLTVVLTPAGSLQPKVEVRAGDGSLLAGATAVAGQKAAVQTLWLAAADTYAVVVSGNNGTLGRYTLDATINAAVEVADSGDGAELALDASRLEIGAGRYAVVGRAGTADDVDEYTLDLTGHAGRPLDVLLAGRDRAALAGATLEVVDLDGTTVLAGGTAAPLGVPAENYGQGVLGLTIPRDGVYTLRVRATAVGDYSLVATSGAVFDSEPNTQDGQPLRSLDGTGVALGAALREPLPDLLYYGFDEGGGSVTRNAALPSAGLLDAPVLGHTLSGAGQFGTALTGGGQSTGYVDTGWTTSLASNSWTVGLWLDRTDIPYDGSTKYLFGDPSARWGAYFDGSAGQGNAVLQGFT